MQTEGYRRILYVDLFCPDGHLDLNRVYLNGLLAYGVGVDAVFKEGYAAKLGLRGINAVHEFPARLFDERCSPLRARWNQWRLLMAVRSALNVDGYAAVFFSSFDELTVALSGRWLGAVYLNHANIAGLDHPLKRWAMRSLGDDSLFVVFHEFIARRARVRGLRRVQTLAQGLPSPGAPPPDADTLLEALDPRLAGRAARRIVFVPAGAKYADGFIRDVVHDPEFGHFMELQNALLVVKSMTLSEPLPSVVAIDRRLSDEEYRALFHASVGLVLHYPATFTYRVSATLMECFASQKPCLLSDIEGFKAFAGHFEYQPYYRTKHDLMKRIESLLGCSGTSWRPYRCLDELVPDFSRALPHWFQPGEQAL